MAITPVKLREIVFLLLYGQEVGNDSLSGLEAIVMDQLKVSRSSVRQGMERSILVLEKKDEIDSIIEKSLKGYDPEKISPVERNILRLGVYELLFDEKIPGKVAISEGIRLAKKFSSAEAAKLINGVLDLVFKTEREES